MNCVTKIRNLEIREEIEKIHTEQRKIQEVWKPVDFHSIQIFL